VVAVTTGLGLAALVGCGCSAGSTDKPAPLIGVGPITFAIGSLDTGNYLSPLLNNWNAAHPREHVTLIPLPEDSDGQVDQMMANLQARSRLYDVMGLDVVSTAEFAANGWIVPLKQKLENFLFPAVATAKYAGTLFAVPFDSNAGLLYYRRDILAAAHDRPPTTWAELQQLASTLAPKYHIKYGYAGQLASYEGLTVNFTEAVQSAGGSILSLDATKVTLDSAADQALQFL
jgi:multiple sugar transport system substrate-binding protein